MFAASITTEGEMIAIPGQRTKHRMLQMAYINYKQLNVRYAQTVIHVNKLINQKIGMENIHC